MPFIVRAVRSWGEIIYGWHNRRKEDTGAIINALFVHERECGTV